LFGEEERDIVLDLRLPALTTPQGTFFLLYPVSLPPLFSLFLPSSLSPRFSPFLLLTGFYFKRKYTAGGHEGFLQQFDHQGTGKCGWNSYSK
jgi:hypothetical protein